MEPIILAAGAIAKLAFDEFMKSASGEVAKKSVGGAIDLVQGLRERIWAKFQGDHKAETAMAQVEQAGDAAALNKLAVYLEDAMADDPAFASDIQQVAQQIINIQHQHTEGDRTYNQTAGRDIFNIEKIEGGTNKLGGA